MKFFLFVAFSVVVGAFGALTPTTPDVVLKQQIPGGSEAEATVQCNDILFQHCQVNFNKALNINSTLDWSQPAAFQQALQYIKHMAGRLGVVQICNAYTLFSQCLGPMYPSCVNPLHFLQQGKSIRVATFYPTILKQMHFECGGGLQTLLSNWDCIGPGEIQYNSTVQICNNDYFNNVTNDPSPTHNACLYAGDLLQCISRPFTHNCNVESGWYECEYARVGLSYHLPYCPLVCNIGVGSGLKEKKLSQDKTIHIGPGKQQFKYLGGLEEHLALNAGPSVQQDIAKIEQSKKN